MTRRSLLWKLAIAMGALQPIVPKVTIAQSADKWNHISYLNGFTVSPELVKDGDLFVSVFTAYAHEIARDMVTRGHDIRAWRTVPHLQILYNDPMDPVRQMLTVKAGFRGAIPELTDVL